MQKNTGGDQAVLAALARDILNELLSVDGAWDVVEGPEVDQALKWLDAVASGTEPAPAVAQQTLFGELLPSLKAVIGVSGRLATATAVKRLVEAILDSIPNYQQSADRLWFTWQSMVWDARSEGSDRRVA